MGTLHEDVWTFTVISLSFSLSLSEFFVEWEMFQTNLEEISKRHILGSINFSENRADFEMTWETQIASLCFYCKIGYAHAPLRTVIRALSILFITASDGYTVHPVQHSSKSLLFRSISLALQRLTLSFKPKFPNHVSVNLSAPCVLYIRTGVSLLSRERFLYF